jgi:hypothetical protein
MYVSAMTAVAKLMLVGQSMRSEVRRQRWPHNGQFSFYEVFISTKIYYATNLLPVINNEVKVKVNLSLYRP